MKWPENKPVDLPKHIEAVIMSGSFEFAMGNAADEEAKDRIRASAREPCFHCGDECCLTEVSVRLTQQHAGKYVVLCATCGRQHMFESPGSLQSRMHITPDQISEIKGASAGVKRDFLMAIARIIDF